MKNAWEEKRRWKQYTHGEFPPNDAVCLMMCCQGMFLELKQVPFLRAWWCWATGTSCLELGAQQTSRKHAGNSRCWLCLPRLCQMASFHIDRPLVSLVRASVCTRVPIAIVNLKGEHCTVLVQKCPLCFVDVKCKPEHCPCSDLWRAWKYLYGQGLIQNIWTEESSM